MRGRERGGGSVACADVAPGRCHTPPPPSLPASATLVSYVHRAQPTAAQSNPPWRALAPCHLTYTASFDSPSLTSTPCFAAWRCALRRSRPQGGRVGVDKVCPLSAAVERAPRPSLSLSGRCR
eukprot:354654-Chlamydomonas_euryale.AAC.1